MLAALSASASAWGPPGQSGGEFKPGWNGLALTPPMGWRSWNAFGNRITQDMMMEAADAIVSKNRTVANNAKKLSLCDLGYCSVGVDEGWEGCGQGVDKTQHDANGIPTIDAAFPDTGKMVKSIHALGLTAGWYLNGCKCGEHVEKEINYAGDVSSLHDFNFNGVKIDRCGRQLNMTLYAKLMKASGKNYTIENCHWGECTEDDASSCPTTEWCPFNWYRSSGDINAGAQSWLANLQTTIKFQDYDKPLSVPGCWAYPDMLEVGRVQAPAPGAFYTWNRAHFGAWCVTSSPLILGLELTDAKLAPVLDIIGNEEAIAVNQQWAGHPGMLVENIVAPPVPYSPAGATVPSNAAGDLDVGSPGAVGGGPADAKTSGAANIRTGGPGETTVIKIGSGVLGNGHKLDSVSLSFRYSAGYTMPSAIKAPTVRVFLFDLASGKELKTIGTTGPLGNYSYDHFKGFSPEVVLEAKGLGLPNDGPIAVAMEVTNNQRNLQIPVDDLAAGFNVKVAWETPTSVAPTSIEPTSLAPVVVAGHQNTPLSGATNLLNTFGTGQLWAKKQPNGASAALLINHSPGPLAYTLSLKKLNLTASKYAWRDVWAHTANGTVSGELKLAVPAYDSAFIVLTPV